MLYAVTSDILFLLCAISKYCNLFMICNNILNRNIFNAMKVASLLRAKQHGGILLLTVCHGYYSWLNHKFSR